MRVVEVTDGSVQFETSIAIRFDYGAILPWLQKLNGGYRAIAGPDCVDFYSEIESKVEAHTIHCKEQLIKGRRVTFQLTWSHTYGNRPVAVDVLEELEKTRSGG